MSAALPQNSEEAAYIAFAIVDELIWLLVNRGIIDASAIDLMLETVAVRLSQGSHVGGQRAAKFVANRMTHKP